MNNYDRNDRLMLYKIFIILNVQDITNNARLSYTFRDPFQIYKEKQQGTNITILKFSKRL